jgi:hypothetical protein
MVRVSKTFKRFGRRFYKFVCSTFLGFGLLVEQRWWGRTDCTVISEETCAWRSQGGRERFGCFPSRLTHLCIESWSPLWFYSVVRGGWVTLFSHFHHTSDQSWTWLASASKHPSYSSAWELARSPVVGGRGSNFSSLIYSRCSPSLKKKSASWLESLSWYMCNLSDSLWFSVGEWTLKAEHSYLFAWPVPSYRLSLCLWILGCSFACCTTCQELKPGKIVSVICEPSSAFRSWGHDLLWRG